jgi:DNA-binding GntR family transcriptional regulator
VLTSNTDGRLPAEPPLPTEAELQEKLGISRSVDGEPIALIETWLPLTETLTAAELTDASPRQALRRSFGIAIVSGRGQVRAVAATPTLESALRAPEALVAAAPAVPSVAALAMPKLSPQAELIRRRAREIEELSMNLEQP